jgi:hypothetical protein
MRLPFATALLLVGLGSGHGAGPAAGGDPAGPAEFAREPSWRQPSREAVARRVAEWLAAVPEDAAGAETVARLRSVWSRGPDGDLVDAVMAAAAAVDDRPRQLMAAIRGGAAALAEATAWFDDTATPTLVRDTARLWAGRELVRQDRFDEALPLLVGLDVAASVDPATLLFHRAACQHWLLETDAALESLDRLLEREAELPARYARVAGLLRADAAALERESLDHIGRRMKDVSQRLALGRAGSGTRSLQDGVIESLDKLIKKLESQQQRQNQGQGGGGAGGGGQGGEGVPMDDSRIAGGKGPGDVQKKDIGSADGWGNLPPHQRDEALQQIGREFPPHYREAIEQYFKRLAASGEER